MAHLLRWIQYWVTESMIDAWTQPDSPAAERLRSKIMAASTSLIRGEGGGWVESGRGGRMIQARGAVWGRGAALREREKSVADDVVCMIGLCIYV
jgi:hypothetical protein